MNKDTVNVLVNQFSDEINTRNKKIESKIQTIENEMALANKRIVDLQESFVELDLAEDETKKERISEEISKVNSKINLLEQERAAYLKAKTPDNASINQKVQKIMEAAFEEVKSIRTSIVKKRQAIENLEKKKIEVEKSIEAEELELINLEHSTNRTAYTLSGIAKYIYGEEKLKEISQARGGGLIKYIEDSIKNADSLIELIPEYRNHSEDGNYSVKVEINNNYSTEAVEENETTEDLKRKGLFQKVIQKVSPRNVLDPGKN